MSVMMHALNALQAIREDMQSGMVPETCASFSELHDYVDANQYVEDVPDEGPDGERDLALVNAVTDAVDAFLQTAVHGTERKHALFVGGPEAGIRIFGPFSAEQAKAEGQRCFNEHAWTVVPLHEPYEGMPLSTRQRKEG